MTSPLRASTRAPTTSRRSAAADASQVAGLGQNLIHPGLEPFVSQTCSARAVRGRNLFRQQSGAASPEYATGDSSARTLSRNLLRESRRNSAAIKCTSGCDHNAAMRLSEEDQTPDRTREYARIHAAGPREVVHVSRRSARRNDDFRPHQSGRDRDVNAGTRQ